MSRFSYVLIPLELNYIKRIVALAGDEVVVRNGVLSVNGEVLPRESQGDKVFQDRHFESSTWFEFNALEETEGNHGVSYEVLADNARPAPTSGTSVHSLYRTAMYL